MRLLTLNEPAPMNAYGTGRLGAFLLVCDHAGRSVPAALGDLGLQEGDLRRHIAWDIGAAGLARRLADRLDCELIAQTYSRLVIDCNRSPDAPDLIPEVSDGTLVPANRSIAPADRRRRLEEIFEPYHQAVSEALDRRREAPLVIFVHSFTPMYQAFDRPWRFGVLHDGGSPFSRRVLQALTEAGPGPVGDNEPYAFGPTDYSAPRHAAARGLDFLELEVRQDLIEGEEGQDAVADFLAPLLLRAASPPGFDPGAPRRLGPGEGER